MGMVDRADVIAEEQRAVDHAYGCADQDRQAVDRFKTGYRTDCADAGLSSHPDAPPEYGQREDIGDLSLVFTRVDLVEDPDGKLAWYLGRRDVVYGDERAVVKWANRLATRWRSATPDDPGEVLFLVACAATGAGYSITATTRFRSSLMGRK
ncbi:hypothetical protein [Nonomuraea sp. NPDC003804]|uniref:hypothetical protein n=1 Tax=Nonomuraea sp. NPDC003804 TaxID=3154547 RepID=UPI00339E11D7